MKSHGLLDRYRIIGVISTLLTLASCGGGGGGDAPDTNPGELQFSAATYQDSESAGGITFTVTRTGGSDGAVSVDVVPGNGTANATQDFDNTTLTITFADGDSAPKNASVNVVNDPDPESNETFNLALANPTGGATLGAQTTAVLTILDDDTASSPGQLQFSAATYQVGEANGNVTVTVTRTNGTLGAVSVDLTTSGGTATANVDYTTTTTTLTFADGDNTAQTVNIPITNDPDPESSENFSVTLSNVTGGASLGTQSSSVVTIFDDDSGTTGSVLNDTGVTLCVNDVGAEFDCASGAGGSDQFPGQDGSSGRDVSNNDNTDGAAGFSFTKLDSNGVPLADQNADYATTPWDCVRDEVTGLVWEVKTDDDGLRDKDWRYVWRFNSSALLDTPNVQQADTNNCSFISARCDTETYIKSVSVNSLCGFQDWRLPSRRELFSLIDFGTRNTQAIDINYFPNTIPIPHWTTNVIPPGFVVQTVEFNEGISAASEPTSGSAIRLVRGGN